MGESGTRMRRWSLRGMAVVAAVALQGCGLADWWIGDPEPHLTLEAIRGIIATESPVFYRDGRTPIGVFFQAEHRQFIPWEALPTAWVVGIVAAEDDGFWTHGGVDPRGIARAMRSNVKAGRMVAGGSTLTQQTAKNLFYRPDRTVRSKLIEGRNALALEAHYDKTEILSFYANQFHVTGNGRGLAIGARHFFDKEVEDLKVAESAFLAGLVKAPSRYDPFLGDEARKVVAMERAQERTRYVLRRITEETLSTLIGPEPEEADRRAAWERRRVEAISVRAEAQSLLDDGFELTFARGSFRYDASAVLDEVARRLAGPPFEEVLRAAGVEDPATAGLKVITTLDAAAQKRAIYALWHHLTEVGTWLEGLGATDFVRDGRGPRFDPDWVPTPFEFRLATVAEHIAEERVHLSVDLGGHMCTVDRDAVVRVAVAAYRGEKQSKTAKAPSSYIDAFVDELAVGSTVWVSVRDVGPDGAWCDLEVRPRLQGSTLVLEDGMMRAMVGGNDNRNFNRATALRQMGSTWKPLVFHAALRLGWSPSDLLDNRRTVFPFSTTYYYPRPDHDPAPVVSMAWAGVNSENLASIWLLYHLIDRLEPDEVIALAGSLDLMPREGEAVEAYRTRIQKAGVLPTRSRLVEGRFLAARQEVLAGFEGPDNERLALGSLLYGWGFEAERGRVARAGSSTRAHKERGLDNSWTHLSELFGRCEEQHRLLDAGLRSQTLPPAHETSLLTVLLDADAIRVACGAVPEGFVSPVEGLGEELVRQRAAARAAARPRRQQRLAPDLVLEDIAAMRVDDRLTLGTVRLLNGAFQRRELSAQLQEEPDLYDPEVLCWHQDFRVLLSLRTVMSLAEQYGVQTELSPVLSLPLGAAEITLEESASLYQGLITGMSFTPAGVGVSGPVAGPPSPSVLIAEIRDVDNRVLYAAQPSTAVVATPVVGEMTADILRNVVRWGTGRRALHAIRLDGGVVPVGGKTGTTNAFKNAAFLGFAPKYGEHGFRASNGMVVGVYVGYDDNAPMVNGRIRLAGASGALPAWMGTIQGLADAGLLGEPTADRDQAWWPLEHSASLQRLAALQGSGIVDRTTEAVAEGPSVLVPRISAVEPAVRFEPVDRPVRVAPTTTEPPAPERRGGLWKRKKRGLGEPR